MVHSVTAEDAVIETEATTQAAIERQKKIQADQERAKALLEKKKVTYDGFVHEVSRAENKKRFFSLKQPRDPANDTKNVSFDERSGKPRGFVLFRVRF